MSKNLRGAAIAGRLSDLALGEAPRDGPWRSAYRLYHRWARTVPVLRRMARGYFLPGALECWRKGALYRLLGVAAFGRVVPTGGILIRRLTGLRMPGHTLDRPGLAGARRYFFRACAVEAAHLAVFLALSAVIGICLALDRAALAAGGGLANLLVNVYPVLLQRYTRVRIALLLARRRPHGSGLRSDGGAS